MFSVLAILPTARLVRRLSKPLSGMDVTWARTLDQARGYLEHRTPDVVICFLELSDGLALDLLDGRSGTPPFPLVVLARQGDEREAVEVMRAGAMDYVAITPRSVAAMAHICKGAKREYQLLQRARIAEDQLRHANRLIGTGRLAAVTAHEVGTPLNVVRMAAQLVISQPEQAEEHARLIIEQVDVVTERLRSMLDYARAGSEQRAPIPLGEVVGEAVELLRPLAVRQGVELVVDRAPHVVVAARQQVRQVVFNLLTNAFQVLPKGGRIEVRAHTVTRAGREYAVIEVIDDGPGVDARSRDHVFEAFYTTKPAGRGTGLGLAVCREIAQTHGGFLELDSVPGRTLLRFGLPMS